MTDEIKEEIKRAIIQSNKDIDFADDDIEENYMRGWLGGNLEIVRILEKHYGKIIDDDEIMKESEERRMMLRTKSEQKAYLDGYEMCAECIEKYLSDKGKQKLKCLLIAVRNAVEIEDIEPQESEEEE